MVWWTSCSGRWASTLEAHGQGVPKGMPHWVGSGWWPEGPSRSKPPRVLWCQAPNPKLLNEGLKKKIIRLQSDCSVLLLTNSAYLLDHLKLGSLQQQELVWTSRKKQRKNENNEAAKVHSKPLFFGYSLTRLWVTCVANTFLFDGKLTQFGPFSAKPGSGK